MKPGPLRSPGRQACTQRKAQTLSPVLAAPSLLKRREREKKGHAKNVITITSSKKHTHAQNSALKCFTDLSCLLAAPVTTGTTRDTFASKRVKQLTYQSYAPLALTTLLALARAVRAKHGLAAIAVVHRLGAVPIGEESILVAVAAPHRQAAWRGGEEALELCKEKVEIWKLEEFEDGEEQGGGGGVWRANRDGHVGVKVEAEADDEASIEAGRM